MRQISSIWLMEEDNSFFKYNTFSYTCSWNYLISNICPLAFSQKKNPSLMSGLLTFQDSTLQCILSTSCTKFKFTIYDSQQLQKHLSLDQITSLQPFGEQADHITLFLTPTIIVVKNFAWRIWDIEIRQRRSNLLSNNNMQRNTDNNLILVHNYISKMLQLSQLLHVCYRTTSMFHRAASNITINYTT